MAVPAENPQLAAHLNDVTRLRLGGLSQQDIDAHYADEVAKLRAGGISETDIRAHYGGQDPAPVVADIQAQQRQNVQVQGSKPSLADSFVQGLTNSSGAALLNVKQEPANPNPDFFQRTASTFGEAVGDTPAMFVGAAIGARAGAAVGAAVPGAGETGASELGGAAIGATIGGGAGAMATPQLIKSERAAFVRAQNQGWGPVEWIKAQAQVLADVSGQAAVGGATAGVGGLAGKALARVAIPTLAKTGAVVAAEAGTMTAAQAAVQRKLPTATDLVEGTIVLAAFHGATTVSDATLGGFRARLQQHYVETGENPLAAAQRAQHDPVLQRELIGERPPTTTSETTITVNGKTHTITGPLAPDGVRAGSSRTPTQPASHPQPDQFVVPRVAGNFDTAVNFTLEHEGGAYVIDANRAGVKWGINAADNPGVDVKNLSRADAAEIYKHKYWDAIDADHLPDNMRLAAFDTAVVEGVGRAKQWLSESGGDPQVFLAKRAAWEAKLARQDPERYGRFVKAWSTRLSALGGHGPAIDLVGGDPTDPMTDSQKALLDNEGQPPEPPEPPEPPDEGEPGDEGFEDRIMAHTNEDGEPRGGWLSGGMDATKRLYEEVFNYEHPIRKLVNAVTEGGPLDDAANPVFLRRLAERSQDDARYTINGDGHGNAGNMTDLDGNITGRSLKGIVDSVGDARTQRLFLRGYAVSRWAQMMHDEGKETGLGHEDVDSFVAKYGPAFEGPFQELVGWRNATLGWLKGGPLSEKMHDLLVSSKEAAVPGYRKMDDGTYKPATSTATGNVYNPIREAKGSERQLLPIEQSLMREAMLRRMLAATNRANVTLADMAIDHGVAGQKRAVDFNVVKTLTQLSHIDEEHNIEGIDDMLSQLARAAGQAVPKDKMPVMRDGKMFAVEFNDEYKDIVPVVRGFDQGTQSLFFKMAARLSAIPRVLQTTANPLFAPHILGMDVMFQHLVNPDAKNVLSSLVSGYGAAVRDPPGYDKWLRQGGAEHVFDHVSKDDYLKSVFKGEQEENPLAGVFNAPQTAWHALQAWNRVNFAALRYGRYQQGLKSGESEQRAAVASTESAYHRIGFGGPVARAINAVMPFTSARLNGLEKTARALMGGAPEVLSGGKIQNKTVLGTDYSFKQTAIRSLAMLTVPAMLSYFAFKDQEWYKAMPDWQKNNAWFIIPPIDGKTPPIPFGAPAPMLSFLFIGLPRMLAERYLQDDPHAFDNWGASATASLAGPVSLPTASFLGPVIEHITNHSFFRDQPLANPDAIKTVGVPEQFNHYSSAEAKGLSQFVGGAGGLSPAVIDNYIHTWGGLPGALSQEASDAVSDQFNANKRPALMPWEMAPFSSYIQRYPSASAKPIVDFYNRANALDAVHGSIVAAMKEGNLGRVQELAAKDPGAAAYHMLRLESEPSGVDPTPYINALAGASAKADWTDLNLVREGERAMKAANAWANVVLDNPRLTPQDKRQQLHLGFQKMQAISEQINDAMDRAHIGGYSPSSHQPPAPGYIDWTPPDGK